MTRGLGKIKRSHRKNPNTNKHKKSVPSIIDSLIDQADIILGVLDARFIEKSRHPEIEKRVKKSGKKIIYILNKADLVDRNKITKIKEMEEIRPYLFFSSKERKGSFTLKKLIKIEFKKMEKDSIKVGVVGYPNTGKSSLINLITGKSSAKTSSEAGYTKGIQKIKLSKGVYLIDTPGIIPPSEKSSVKSKHLIKHSQIGAITWDKTKQPSLVVSKMMMENKGILEKYYGVNAKGDSEILIENLGRKSNYLKKGGEVDEMRTAKKILKDWQEGKIKQT